MAEITEDLIVKIDESQLGAVIFLSNDHAATEFALLQLQRYIKEGVEPIIPIGGFFLDGRLNSAFNSVIEEIKIKKGGE